MVKPSCKDQGRTGHPRLSDSNINVSNPSRTLRSNAAVSQIFIASSAASSNANLSELNLPYSTGTNGKSGSSSTSNNNNESVINFKLNPINLKSPDTFSTPLNLTGASILSQDFFSKAAPNDSTKDDDISIPEPKSIEIRMAVCKNSAKDNENKCQTQTPSRDVNQEKSREHSHSLPITSFSDYPTSSVISQLAKGSNIGTSDIMKSPNTSICQYNDRFGMCDGGGQDSSSGTNFLINDQARCPQGAKAGDSIAAKRINLNHNDDIATQDLLTNLKSLIFDDHNASHLTKQTSHTQGTPNLDCNKMTDHACKLQENKDQSTEVCADIKLSSTEKSPPKSSANLNTTVSSNLMDPTPGPSHYVSNIPTNQPQSNMKESSVVVTRERSNSQAIYIRKHDRSSRSGRRARRAGSVQDKRFATISKLPSISSMTDTSQQQFPGMNSDLPPNWEARLDAHGRVFYIDHERRTTTWHRPTTVTNVIESVTHAASSSSTVYEAAKSDEQIPETRDQNFTHGAVTSNINNPLNDSTEQQRALLNRRYTLRRTISTRRQSKNFDDISNELSLNKSLDACKGISTPAKGSHDTIDGNCMSGPATQRARSYNMCVDISTQSIQSNQYNTDHPQTSSHPIPSTSFGSSQVQTASGHRPKHQLSPSICCPPALKFLNRSDFFNVLHLNDEALMLYNASTNLKYIINRVRKDKTNSAYERFQHNKDLVAFLNKFTLTDEAMLPGWEIKVDHQGKCFFIDHMRKATTYVDPRLPTEVPTVTPNQVSLHPHRNPSSSNLQESTISELPEDANNIENSASSATSTAPAGREPVRSGRSNLSLAATNVPTTHNRQTVTYEEKVVAFFKQSNVFEIIKAKRSAAGLLNSSLKEKINQIRKGGVNTLKKFSHDVNLTLIISLFDSEIDAISSSRPNNTPQLRLHLGRLNAPGKRDFEEKLRYFYRKLEQKNFGQGPNKLKLSIRRDHILEDAFTKVMSVNSKKDLQRSRLYVSFAGEEGLDYGGPSREFFFLLSRELFNPYYGLFEYSANDTYTVQISPMSRFVDNYHDWFRFSGRMLGLALIHQYLMDAFFTRPFYKSLLKSSCSLSDLEYLDAEFHQSLQWVKEADISDLDLDLSFSVIEEVAGKVIEKELKPNGRNVAVTEKNKREYIEKMVKWRLERGVREQTESLVKGFYEVIDPRLVGVFDARELELVIAGTAEIDVKDWRKNTDYRSGYHDSHLIIQWFWTVIEQKFDNDQRLRLLQFVTGTSSIPYEGFEALRGSNGPRKFCIEKWGKPESLPRAHTCFNRLDLPPYASLEILHEKLLMAVEESSSFGIE